MRHTSPVCTASPRASCVVLATLGLIVLTTGCTRPTTVGGPSAPSTAPSSVGGADRSGSQSTLPTPSPTTIDSTEPAAGATRLIGYEYPKAGIKLNVPDWKKVDDKDYVMAVGDESSEFSLDVPDLPAHPPGFLPLRLVVNGFIDDLKKKDQSLKIIDDADYKVPGGSARRVRFDWSEKGVAQHGVAILIVHDDHVYILRFEGDARQSDANDKLMDQAAKSIEWEKATK